MSCRQIDLGPNASAFICGPKKRRVECAYCKARDAVFLCDYELRGKKAGKTCDGKLCASCATVVGENRHLCPPHRRERDAQLAKERDAEAWLDQLVGESQASQGSAEVTASQDAAVPREDTTSGENVLGEVAPWEALPDDPPVGPIAAELRARDVASAGETNMYGCTPCPTCGSRYRYPTKKREIACDDCGRVQAESVMPCVRCTKTRAFRPDCECEGIVCGECCGCTMSAAHENAVLMSQRKDTQGARPCHICGGHVVIVGKRAWCVKRYVDGGCGAYWTATDADRPRRATPARAEVTQGQIENELRLAFAADDSRAQRDRELRQRADVPIADKVAHVRSARQTRNHACHWPDCPEQVPPAMWGCKRHWMTLPRNIRDRIWSAYAPGQERTLSPSSEYLEAAEDAQRWIRQHLAELGEVEAPPRRVSWDQAVRDARARDAARGAPVVEDRPTPPPTRRAKQLALDAVDVPWRGLRPKLAPSGDVAQDLEARGENEEDQKHEPGPIDESDFADEPMPWDD